MDYIKVKDHDSLVRDPNTGAIVNSNRGEFLKHVEARKKMHRIETVVDDINNLKDEVSEIKALLRELIKNASN
jgi:tetrahydromethanopterin S-methyltransferase subunit B